jgi:hypothetical protein
VHALAQRRWRVAAGVAALLALGTFGVVGGSFFADAGNHQVGCPPDRFSCGGGLDYAIGSIVIILGAAALAAGTAVGVIHLRKPDAEVKAGRGDLTYVE